MTKLELKILEILGDAFRRFLLLPEIHPSDKGEFILAIHHAQNIVLSREGMRSSSELTDPKKKAVRK